MAWKCIVEGKELADQRADRRASRSIEKYNVSAKAVYFDGQYLPLELVRSLRVQPSVYTPQGCCGRGIPVLKVRLDYGAEKPVILMIEQEKNAARLVEAIREANPGVAVEEYVDPHTGEAPARMLAL